MILEVLLPALLPTLADGARGLFNRLTGGAGAKPANVEEVVTLMNAETERLKALAAMDKSENTAQWVGNIRALQRPLASFLIIGCYVGAIAMSADSLIVENIGSYAQMVTFYLFGDRTLAYAKKGK